MERTKRQTAPGASYYYVAQPSTKLRANVLQTLNTIRYLRKLCPELNVVVPSRSETINEIFREFDPINPRGHLLYSVSSRLPRGSRIRDWLEVALDSLFLLGHVLVRDRGSRKVFYSRSYQLSVVLALILCPLLNSKLIIEAHQVGVRDRRVFKRRGANANFGRMERRMLDRADRIVVFTHEAVRIMQANGQTVEDRVRVIPHGFDPAVFSPRDRDASRQQLGLDPHMTYVVYSGLSFIHRQVDKIVYAAKDLAARDDVEFIVVGGQPGERSELERLAVALGVSNTVRFVGIVDQQQASLYLGAADVLVIPGALVSETGLPLKLVEYLAMGQPLVCPDTPVFREVVGDDAAYFFTEALAPGIEQALSDPRRGEKGARARQVAEPYTYAHRAQRIVHLLEELAAELL
jgi:glycosyltransferase involved in cell wall biosynthesis